MKPQCVNIQMKAFSKVVFSQSTVYYAYNNTAFEEKARCLEMSSGLRSDHSNFRLLNSAFSGANKHSPWWTALKALLPPGAPWAPPGDPIVSWDCERWWFAKSTVRSFLACLETSTAEGFKYSEGTSLKKNVLLGSNWNRSAKKKDSSRFCFTIKFY